MGLETKIPTEPIKEKLKNLRKYMETPVNEVYDFAEFFAERVNPTLRPSEFYMALHLALYDLQEGVNGFTRKPIENRLVGYPSTFYGCLRILMQDVVKAVCPEDFANEVLKLYRQNDAGDKN